MLRKAERTVWLGADHEGRVLEVMSRAHLVAAPFSATVAIELPPLVVSPELDGQFDYLHLFTTSQAGMDDSFPALKEHLAAAGSLWVSWPRPRNSAPTCHCRQW